MSKSASLPVRQNMDINNIFWKKKIRHTVVFRKYPDPGKSKVLSSPKQRWT